MPIATERVVSVLGSTSVGKSALTLMFINNEFVENYDPTIAKSYTKKNFQLDGKQYSLTVNDTAGLEEQSQIQTMYLNSDGFILVYSIADAQSFHIVETIYNKLLDELNGQKPVVLIGNKCDLKEQRRVDYEHGRKLADSWKAAFLETSAKDQKAVVNVFQTLLKQMDFDKQTDSNLKLNSNNIMSQANTYYNNNGNNINGGSGGLNNMPNGNAKMVRQNEREKKDERNCTIS